MKKFILLFSILIVFSPLISHAQDLEGDPRCFTKTECFEARAEQGSSNPKNPDAFYTGSDTDVCDPLEEDEEMGFCLPAGQASTQISFGGVRDFPNIGVFIQQMYKWSVGAGSILAVLVILVSGIQWIVSGGNSQTIKSAKKRIGGAIGGLVLLAGSFTILGTINPALVNLRLPQSWMIQEKEFPTAKGDGTCNPVQNDKQNHNPNCKSNQICVGLGPGATSGSACDKLAVASVLAPLGMWGGASAAAATVPGGGAAGLISSGYQAAGTKIAELSLPSVGGAVKGIYTGSKVILIRGSQAAGLATAIGVEEATLGLGQKGVALADETVDNILGSSQGVCLNEPSKRDVGQFCTPGKGNCKEGLHCVIDDTVSGMTQCWTGQATGFCSDGKNGSICQDHSDCDKACRTIEYGSTFSYKACSNGLEGAPCNNDNHCGQIDDENLVCSSHKCIRESEVIPENSVPEGGRCTMNSQCQDIEGAEASCWLTIQVQGECQANQTSDPQYEGRCYQTGGDAENAMCN